MEWKLETEIGSENGNRNGNATSQLLYVGLRSSYCTCNVAKYYYSEKSQRDKIVSTDFTKQQQIGNANSTLCHTVVLQQDLRAISFYSQVFRAYMLPSLA